MDPAGLGGLWLRARAGPVREVLRERLRDMLGAVPLPCRTLHPAIADEALYGGIDLGATLAAGRTVRDAGLLARPAALILTMAERCPPGLAARLALALDEGGHCLIAFDEGAAGDEVLPTALADRLALFVDPGAIAWSDCEGAPTDAATLAAARARLPGVATPPGARRALTAAAAQLGIGSLRAPMLALRAARAAAALRGADTVTEDDLRLAAELVLAHRGLPPSEAEPPAPPADDPAAPDPRDSPSTGALPPEEVLVAAARAALPPDLLAALATGRAAAARAASGGSGAGARRRGNRRGRPLPSRPGRPGSGVRIDLVATLRTAAPWQPLRRAQAHAPAGRPLHLRPADIRIRRAQDRSDRLLVFAVDASGSAAFARLAEAKGAVELLLAAAYARRDHVALIAFRGTGAEVLLPPTRSLVQTKRRLAALPGGGGTPLAAGLQAALHLALRARARGMTPALALLTDGRANIALDGTPGRAQAGADAARMAALWADTGLRAAVIDTGLRPQPALDALAAAMGARALPLPRADAQGLSAALAHALDGA